MADSPANAAGRGPLARFLAMPNDDPLKTVLVALLLCLVCAVAVSVAAVTLRPLQERNKDLAFKREVLKVAGLYMPGSDIAGPVQTDRRAHGGPGDRRVPSRPRPERATPPRRRPATPGRARQSRRPRTWRTSNAAPASSRCIWCIEGRRLSLIILPVYGTGLWSTLYGLLALRADANRVAGVSFYEQAETPASGPRWPIPSGRPAGLASVSTTTPTRCGFIWSKAVSPAKAKRPPTAWTRLSRRDPDQQRRHGSGALLAR